MKFKEKPQFNRSKWEKQKDKKEDRREDDRGRWSELTPSECLRRGIPYKGAIVAAINSISSELRAL